MRAVDEERISETKSLLLKSIEVETKVMNIMQRCYDDMKKAAESVSPFNDSASVVLLYRFVLVKFYLTLVRFKEIYSGTFKRGIIVVKMLRNRMIR